MRYASKESSSETAQKVKEKKDDDDEEYVETTYDWTVEKFPHKWHPDLRYAKDQAGTFYYYDHLDYRYVEKGWHDGLTQDTLVCPPEKQGKNIWMNFGPAHPAAHGVLRLIVEMEGEVLK